MVRFSQVKGKTYFVRILSSNLIMIALTTFILSIVLYYSYQTIGIKQVNQSILKQLSQTSYSANYLKESALASTTQVYFDKNILMAMNSYTLNDQEINTVADQLTQVVNSTNYIHSISVYNGNLDLLISTRNFSDIDEKKFIKDYVSKMVANSSQTNKILPVVRKLQDSYKYNDFIKYKSSYTFLMFDYSKDTKKPISAIVINIKEDWIRNIISSLDSAKTTVTNSKTFIIDQKGKIVSHTNENEFLKDISTDSYIRKILDNKSAAGSFISQVDGKKALVSFVSSDILDWRFISITPYKDFMQDMDKLKNYTILFSILIFVIGIFISLLVSRNFYNPIKALVNSAILSTGDKHYATKNMNELQVIQNIFDETVIRKNELEELKRENANTMREDVLRKLLLSKETFQNNKSDKFAKDLDLKINLNAPSLILLLKVDDYYTFCINNSRKDRELLLFGIGNIVSEILTTSFITDTVSIGDDLVAAIINVDSTKSEDEIFLMLTVLIEKIQSACSEYMNISITASIGCICNNSTYAGISFEFALNIMEYRIKFGHKAILTRHLLEDKSTDTYIYPIKKENSFMEALKLGRKTQALETFNEVSSHALCYDIDNIKSAFLRIAIVLNTVAHAFSKSQKFDNIFNMDSIIGNINKLETINQLNDMFKNLICKLIDGQNENRSNRSNELVQNIMNKINQTYMDCNLSLDKIADVENMSAAYIGRLFKENTSKSVSEYISEVRISKACILLMESSLTASDIAGKVGFINLSHFYTVFKKSYGVTPNEYRKGAASTEDSSKD